jgi:hypothetical protein
LTINSFSDEQTLAEKPAASATNLQAEKNREAQGFPV